MTDWPNIKQLLLENSETVVRAFFAENKDAIAAIGYVFEFGRGQLCFDMCANSKKSLAKSLAESPDDDEVRWNSGDFDYPGGVQEECGDWSQALWDELAKLDQLAADEAQSKSVHDGMAEVCCEVLAELAKRGAFGDWSAIDFNVAALLDDVKLVKERDAQVRDMIRSGEAPKRTRK